MGPDGPEITNRREIAVAAAAWRVVEFDHGERYMLIAATAGTQYQAHFDSEQWAELQRLIAGGAEA